jgi:hypothetical protein
MSTRSVEIPEEVIKSAEEAAHAHGQSVDQFLTTVIRQWIAHEETQSLVEEMARKGARHNLQAFLDEVPDVEPPDYDRLPDRLRRS